MLDVHELIFAVAESIAIGHPVAAIFPHDPDMLNRPGSEVDLLATDIRINGLQEPIELLDDMILCGRRRYLACFVLGKEKEQIFTNRLPDGVPGDPIAYVLKSNQDRLARMTKSQRGMVGARIMRYCLDSPLYRKKRWPKTAQYYAEMVGVLSRPVRDAGLVLRRGCRELIAAVDYNRITAENAYEISNLDHDAQRVELQKHTEPLKRLRSGEKATAKPCTNCSSSEWTKTSVRHDG